LHEDLRLACRLSPLGGILEPPLTTLGAGMEKLCRWPITATMSGTKVLGGNTEVSMINEQHISFPRRLRSPLITLSSRLPEGSLEVGYLVRSESLSLGAHRSTVTPSYLLTTN
jgi:hypothetical protein